MVILRSLVTLNVPSDTADLNVHVNLEPEAKTFITC